MLFAIGVVASPHLADACGVWHMKDVDKKLDISWLVNAGSISGAKGRLAALYLDDENTTTGLRVVANKKVIFDVANGKLRKYGKPVATYDAKGVTFGNKTFAWEFTDRKLLHGMPAWTLTVKLGDKTIVESKEASALCAIGAASSKGIQLTDDDQHEEIRRRVMFYLAWRELGV